MPEAAQRNSVVIVVDGLGAGWIGPYGNTWLETPAFNQLASESLLYEFAQIVAPDLDEAYRSMWLGQHAMHSRPAQPLPAALNELGVHSLLLTDEVELAEHDLAEQFAVREMRPAPSADAAAEHVSMTQIGQLCAQALDLLQGRSPPFCLWLHLQGLCGLWDAPWPLRAALADEEDPPPPEGVCPPEGDFDAAADPDAWLGWMQAAGAQTMALDDCLAPLLHWLDTSPDTMTVLAGARGYPLGEHGVAGVHHSPLYNELIQVPLLVRRPDRQPVRSQQLVQPQRIYDELLNWHQGDRASRPPIHLDLRRQLAVCRRQSSQREVAARQEPRPAAEFGLRTASWYARVPADQPVELFGKPDDRNEINEVASRCVQQVQDVRLLLDDYLQNEQAEVPESLWRPQ